MEVPAPIKRHPNASLAAGAGTPGGIAIWLAGRFGVSLSAEDGYYIAVAVITVVLAIGRRGLVGLWQMLMHGNQEQA
jgi:hypothetical protein